MIILHVCYSDSNGGAARAAYRLHKAQRRNGIDSRMLVIDKFSDDVNVLTVSRLTKLRIKINALLARKLLKLQKTPNTILHSLNFFPSGLKRIINKINPDIVNLHWLGGEMLSIGEIANLKPPVVWTLHDMWAFCGCEHYDDDERSERYRKAYDKKTKAINQMGIDLNKLIYHYKKYRWFDSSFHIITPSKWLEGCVNASSLLNQMSVTTISNCIDHQRYSPFDKIFARQVLGLPLEKNLILFGAMSSTSDHRKGYHLLIPALQEIAQMEQGENLALIIFGASHGDAQNMTGIPTFYMGHIYDDATLALLYNAANIMIVPSTQENLPQTATEAQACGCPVVAFNTTGLKDTVEHLKTGYLANTFDPSDMANGIKWLLNNSREDNNNISINARKKAVKNWSEYIVVTQYMNIYNDLLK